MSHDSSRTEYIWMKYKINYWNFMILMNYEPICPSCIHYNISLLYCMLLHCVRVLCTLIVYKICTLYTFKRWLELLTTTTHLMETHTQQEHCHFRLTFYTTTYTSQINNSTKLSNSPTKVHLILLKHKFYWKQFQNGHMHNHSMYKILTCDRCV